MFAGSPVTTPEAVFNPDLFVEAAGTLALSTGQTNSIQIDLGPGQYVEFCFISGPGDIPIHAAMGMYKIITVE